MDDQEKKDLAAAISAGVAASVLKKQDAANEVAFAKLEKDVEQVEKELEILWKWKAENEALLLWARGFMESYRRTLGVVLASGAIALIGFLLQAYYSMNKGK